MKRRGKRTPPESLQDRVERYEYDLRRADVLRGELLALRGKLREAETNAAHANTVAKTCADQLAETKARVEAIERVLRTRGESA